MGYDGAGAGTSSSSSSPSPSWSSSLGRSASSSLVSFAFVFNLLIGAGALAIPRPFAQTGFVLAAPFLGFLCFFSLLTSMYMVEVLVAVRLMSPSSTSDDDGHHHHRDKDKASRSASAEEDHLDQEGISLSAPVEENGAGASRAGAITSNVHRSAASASAALLGPERVPLLEGESSLESLAGGAQEGPKNLEMGALAKKLFTPLGSKLTYVVLCLYLFGDLSIYAVTIPKSLTALVCPHQGTARAELAGGMSDWPCKNFQGSLPKEHFLHDLNSKTVYRSFVLLLGAVQLPFMFQTVQKTLFIQVLSITYRWSAFFIMVIICLVQMLGPEGEGNDWKHFTGQRDYGGLMQLFGVTIYSFMCHHSLPSLLNPVMSAIPKERLEMRRIAKPVAWALVCCLFVYLMLNTIVALRYKPGEIEDVITLNFQNFKPHRVSVFLELFPVCTLGASFPIIACTLRNNLQTLILMSNTERPRPRWLRIVEKVVLPVVVLLLPLMVAFATENVEMLVGLTGSYGGCAIEFIIPTLLVVAARKRVAANTQSTGGLLLSKLDLGILSSNFFVNAVLMWSVACIVLVTVNHLR
ncbi:putative transmembrane amino acid transporter [Chloropicon primus]|uniref:Putative transmembrane amino acid transporter n=1 Tax=Chloropicon primus TaxID=1764295 RepID=A0A5B8MBT7_9CHLO|nr:putative transmembrane amino acid transporter [Chloropicon primus]|eukprot:QDZ17534.1 putative transmembrane amino acid transporter [Chloropicon primus]